MWKGFAGGGSGRQHHGQLSRSQTPAEALSDYYSSQTPSRITVLVDTFTCALSIVLCWLCTFNIVIFCLDFKGEAKASCHTSVIITQNRFIFKSLFLSRHVLRNKIY